MDERRTAATPEVRRHEGTTRALGPCVESSSRSASGTNSRFAYLADSINMEVARRSNRLSDDQLRKIYDQT